MSRHQVSILLPTHNSEKYIEEQIVSIRTQSFSDFELLIYDDASTDRTVDILRKHVQADQRLQLLVGSTNQGQNRRLRALAAQAAGAYIAFSDHDDIWDQRKLELLYNKIIASRGGLVFGSSHLINADGQNLGQTLHDLARLDILPNDRLRSLFFPLVSGHATLVERHLVWDGTFAGTMLFDWLLSLDAQFAAGVAFEASAVTYHRVHGSNQSNSDLQRGTRDVRLFPRALFPRSLLSSGYDDRWRFFKRVSHLACSPIVPRDRQLTFQEIADVCELAWFSSLVRRWRYKARCRDVLQAKLLPMASNQDDAKLAQGCITSLCSSVRRRRSFALVR